MKYKIFIDDFEMDKWEQCAHNFSDYNLYQTWGYQKVRAENDHQEINRVIVTDDTDKVVIMCQVRIKKIGLLGLTIGYVQGGPLFAREGAEIENLTGAFQFFQRTYVGSRVNVLRVAPNIYNNETKIYISPILKSCGFEFAYTKKLFRTMIYPLDISEQEMRSKLHRSWRRYLNKAEKNNIEIREGTDQEYFNVLEELYCSALGRKQFKGLEPREFVETQRLLSLHEKMNIVVAYYDGQPVTAHATSHLGDTALGILTASNDTGLRCWASYLVWWRTLLAGKKANMEKYDLGGIDQEGNPHVYQFKSRMGAQEADHIGVFDSCSCMRSKITWQIAQRIYHLVK